MTKKYKKEIFEKNRDILDIDKKTIHKIGSVPFQYMEDSIVFIEDGKIYIAKKN